MLCSPNAAKSIWVDKEIRHFRETGRADKVLALIITGTPNSGDPATECFPLAFRETEPLAANLVTDGRQSALTRVTASLANVPFDALWQRERRRQRRQMALGAGLVSFGLLLTTGAIGAGWMALTGMVKAERQSSSIIARESKAIFNSNNPNMATSTLMALQADPSASRTPLRHHFDGNTGYAFARARMVAGHANNHVRQVIYGPVTSVGVSPDGRLVTGTYNNTARLWDLETGENIRAFKHSPEGIKHSRETVTSVAVTSDGRLVTGSWDSGSLLIEAELWDLETGEHIRTFKSHAVVPGRKTAGQATNRGKLVVDSHLGSVYSVAVTADGHLIAGARDNTARLWMWRPVRRYEPLPAIRMTSPP